MHHFNQAELKQLIEFDHSPAVSIYLPTHEVSTLQDRRDEISLKNALQRAEIMLQEHHIAPGNTRRFLEPAYALLEDKRFWQYQQQGLAIFMGENFFRVYRLPIAFEEQLMVNQHFQITPLMAYFEHERSFLLLCLSLQQLRLFKCSYDTIADLPTDELPDSLQAFLNDDSYDPHVQSHSASAGAGISAFHSNVDEQSYKKEQALHYCQRICEGLHGMLHESRLPLVVASVDYLFAMFKKVCDYPGLVESPILGNPEHLSAPILHQKALDVVQPALEAERKQALQHLQEIQHTQRVLVKPDEIAEAARNSRVGRLFVVSEPLSPEKTTADRDGAQASSSQQELINQATIDTYLNGGEIFTLAPGEVQGVRNLAAILRY